MEFHRRFFRLAIVNILANLMVPLAGMVDVAFLGHLADIRHLAGVALATVLFNYIYWTFGFLRMGTTGPTAQAIGRGDESSVLLIGLRNGLLAVSLGLLILILQYPLREIGFALLSAAPDVKLAGQAYYDALIWGAPATLLNYVLLGWFLGQEQGGKVFWLSMVSNGANIVLDYWLINRWGWESAGAGWATALSQYLMLLIGLGLILWEMNRGRWRSPLLALFQHNSAIARQLFDPATLKATLMLNSNILVRTFALVSTFALFTNLSATLGTVILATNTVILQVVTLAAYCIDGLAFATESFAGNFRGQQQSAQLRYLVQLSGSVSLGSGVAVALVFVVLPQPLFALLTSHADVLDSIQRYVLWLLPVLSFGSIAYMLDGYFLGLTEGKILRQSSVIATGVGFLPMAIAAWQLHSVQLLWLALTSFMAARVITLGLRVPETLGRYGGDRQPD